MARIFSDKKDGDRPRISREEVTRFFEDRAKKHESLGSIRAVVYQDKHPDLAETRDAAEKNLLTPKIALNGQNRLLDIGCGTGRWAGVLIPQCTYYHGIDLSPGLVDIAKAAYGNPGLVDFTVTPIDELSQEKLGISSLFDRIICMGVLIYLNDDELEKALKAIGRVTAEHCRIIIREPIALEKRLTIKEHFSEEMEQTYNAIYRTEEELVAAFELTLFAKGFRLAESGDVYTDPALNNRRETQQRWFCLER